jgi:hypothetical protein
MSGAMTALATLVTLAVALVSADAAGAEWPVTVGAQEVWDAATDRSTQTRFIPMQLIVPGVWDGTRQIHYPSANAHDSEGTIWTGPFEWRHPHTGETLTIYDRHRSNRREGSVEQKMAVRADGSAIGRAYDSRSDSFCDQEAKFPLGVWKQGEVRTYEYVCRRSRGGQLEERRRTARITIEELDYGYHGTAHSLRLAWRYSDRDSGNVLDHRTYIFSPGRGLVAHDRR